VLSNGGIEYAESEADKYIKKAKDSISSFPENDYKTSLNSLVDFVVNRKN
jgi:geranylgeranyl pyrophosphate synthase